ncbi:MAG TPA: formyltetrahydrofolate deformylase [Smithella sp.]|jgi:formyltetrahydrofolate deformylase|nr:formyltetrahydrofolate deformylase [Smithella sp.]OQC51620.1 MAG: Formyltetrahydrofolate deformylase [Deltaproteobacteria bacterium ADurb.Bin022]HOE33076.1 formyltetrahydrofolate deformylase [Smithella sp.]HOO35805.1 formyltetrahydrofolate deformylase [Smithella sp.]HOX97855.1 formyltetrahydrofolate deformylase [Smithella sp.]
MNNVNAVLLLSCADSKGLVARISDFIFRFDGNIVHADQYTAKAEKLFFMRVEWELNGFALDRDDIPVAFAPLAKQYQMKWDLHFTDYVPRAAIFVSRHLHCLHDLILRRDMGELAADIKAVISNHEDARDLAEQYGMQYFYFPVTGKNKKQQEKKELRLLRDLHIDLVVLARYMQILSGNFLKYYPSRIINIHHSFLPAFAGRNPYQQAYDRGVKIIGATGHYVTAQLDEGPIIAQDVVKISHRDTVTDIQRKSKDLERIVLARALRLHLENRILVYGSKTIVFE